MLSKSMMATSVALAASSPAWALTMTQSFSAYQNSMSANISLIDQYNGPFSLTGVHFDYQVNISSSGQNYQMMFGVTPTPYLQSYNASLGINVMAGSQAFSNSRIISGATLCDQYNCALSASGTNSFDAGVDLFRGSGQVTITSASFMAPYLSTLYQRSFGYANVAGTVTYEFSDPVSAAVPEPASWASMVAGFAAIGGAIRARRKFALRQRTVA